MASLDKIVLVITAAIVTSSRATTQLTADVMTSSGTRENGEFQIYPKEKCNLRVFVTHHASLRHLKLTLNFNVTSHRGLTPLLRSYGFSNPEQSIERISVTASGGSVVFNIQYKENSNSREGTLHIEALADDVKVGDVIVIDVTAE